MKRATMKIQRVSIASLKHDPANVRTHGERNREAIMRSLARFGQQKPIVVDANDIVVAGNATLDAAVELGWDTIDVVRTHLTGQEAMAYAIADNRASELAEWDQAALVEQLTALQDVDDLIEAAGFTTKELESMIDKSVAFGEGSEEGASELGALEYRIIVDCDGETHQAQLLAQFEREGLICRALTS